MVWLIAAAIVVTVLLLLWISTLLSRRWFVTIRRSEETELIAFHLRRIADAVERLSLERETHIPMETPTNRSVGMSTFSR